MSLTWGLVGVTVGVGVHVANLIGALRSQATSGLTVPPVNGGLATLSYIVFTIVLTPVSLAFAGVLTISRPMRPFALGMIAGTLVGVVVVSLLAFAIIPNPPIDGEP